MMIFSRMPLARDRKICTVWGWFFLVFSFFCVSVRAQKVPFEAIQASEQPKYHFDLARNFYRTPEQEKAERKRVYSLIDQLQQLSAHLNRSGRDLYSALQVHDELEKEFRRHDLYLFLRYAINTEDETAEKEEDQLASEVRLARVSFQQHLSNIDDASWQRLVRQQPKLSKYTYAVASARKRGAHMLPQTEEQLLTSLSFLTSGDFYNQIISHTQFGVVHTPSGDLDVMNQAGEIQNSPDPMVRKEGDEKLWAGYSSHREVLAFGLIQQVKTLDKLSQLQHYPDYRAKVFLKNELTKEEVSSSYEQIAGIAELNKEFESIPSDELADQPRFTIQQATEIIIKALEPLGSEYSVELSQLLNPENGRIDIVGGQHRLPLQGTSSVYPVGTSVFYASKFEGYYIDLMILAHEAGHAVQAMLMSRHQVPMTFAAGPDYFTESYGRFNEFLVAEYLYRTETDSHRKAYFLHQLVTRLMVIFGATAEAAIELAIHQGINEEQIKSADDLDKLTQQVGSRYSPRFYQDKNEKMMWTRAESYYTAPMFTAGNQFANLLVLKYYALYRRNPQDFLPKYQALLRNGYDDEPNTMLRRFLGFDLSEKDLVAQISALLRDQVQRLTAIGVHSPKH